jgi:ATP-dependent RNA helicase RhlE
VLANQRGALLVELLRRGHIDDALVFTRTKHRADRLARLLNRNGIFAERIHGNRSQPQRTKALAGFKSGKFRVLVATDIAARGIDVEALGHVVNFDVPAAPDDYIHRVGRTARAEATGEALTLVMPESEADLAGIERALGLTIPRIRLEDFAYGVAPSAPQGGNAKNRAKSTAQRSGNARWSTAKPANGKRAATQSANGSSEGKNRPRRRRYGKRRT